MHVRHADVEPDDFSSPKGAFAATFRELLTTEATGCPFDIEHVTLPPGKRNFPFHAHGAMWEMYYVLSGTPTMRTDEEEVQLAPGDTYLCKPGLAHQLRNDGGEPVTYLVMSDDVSYEAVYYPDSGKLNPRAGRLWRAMPEDTPTFWQPREGADYWTGEE